MKNYKIIFNSYRKFIKSSYRLLLIRKSKKCDVLIQVDNFLAGGLENVIIDLLKVFSEAELEAQLLVLGQSGRSVRIVQNMKVQVIEIPFNRLSYKILLKILQPRLVMAHYSFNGAAECKESGIPFIQVIHNIYAWFSQNELMKFTRAASNTALFIAVSQAAKDYSIKRLGVDREKCLVIPNGINLAPTLQHEEREKIRNRIGIDSSAFVFLSVGAINHQKNHISTIRSFLEALKVNPGLTLMIVGPSYEPVMLEEILTLIRISGAQDKIFYIGSSDKVYEYYNIANAFVHNAFFEGGPLVLLEAVVANLPIITTNVGFSSFFLNHQGVKVLPPHLDMLDFNGDLTMLESSALVEALLTKEMLECARNPIKPSLQRHFPFFKKEECYKNYISVVNSVINGIKINSECCNFKSWTDIINKKNKNELI